MKRMRFLLICCVAFVACAALYCPIFHAMPRFMERYDADAKAKAELKGKCTVCHQNEDGFGQLNTLGKVFADSNYRITDEVRRKAPEQFATEGITVGGGALAAKPVTPAFDVKVYYDKNCASCHGADGKGGDAMVGIPNFTNAGWQQRRTDERMAEVIAKGKGTMPGWKEKMSDEQITTMVGFVRSFSTQK